MAVALVVLYHCFTVMPFKMGWMGVDLFFVLSGFLITGILVDSKQDAGYYRNFIARRALRIFPLYYFVLLLCMVVLPLLTPAFAGADYGYYLQHQGWFWLYGQNWLYSKTGFPQNHTLIHFWSLAVEEQFYIFWPLVVKLFDTKKLLYCCIALIVFSICFRLLPGNWLGLSFPFQYMATLSRLDALCLGAATAVLLRLDAQWLARYISRIALVAAIIAVAGMVYFRGISFLKLYPVFTCVDICFVWLLLHALSNQPSLFKRFAENKTLRFLGKYSYGIYIYHYVLLNILQAHVSPRIAARLHTGTHSTEFIISVITIAIAVGISVLSFHYLEMPFLRLKKYFTYQPAAIVHTANEWAAAEKDG